jgi:hypothetical protein
MSNASRNAPDLRLGIVSPTTVIVARGTLIAIENKA